MRRLRRGGWRRSKTSRRVLPGLGRSESHDGLRVEYFRELLMGCCRTLPRLSASSRSSMNPGISTSTWSKTSGRTASLPARPAPRSSGNLKQRGLLEDTLVIRDGEFRRTPMVQGVEDGRGHHPNAFTMRMTCGGIKPGIALGESGEPGVNVAKDKVRVHDLHAT